MEMSKDWAYARMSQEASNAGGPDKWLKVMKDAAYDAGATEMKNTLVTPLLVTGAVVGSLGVISVQKIHKWNLERKQKRLLAEQESDNVEKFTIQLSETID